MGKRPQRIWTYPEAEDVELVGEGGQRFVPMENKMYWGFSGEGEEPRIKM